MLGKRYALPGLIAGVVAGPGSLFAVGRYLGSVTVAYSVIMCLFGFVGALPGIGLGIGLGFLLKRIMGYEPPPET